jgi:hypothetical protein
VPAAEPAAPAAEVATGHPDPDPLTLTETTGQPPVQYQRTIPVDPNNGGGGRETPIRVGDRVWVMVAGQPQPAHVLSIHHLDEHFDEYVVRTLDQPDMEGRNGNTRTADTGVHRRLRLRSRDELPSSWFEIGSSRPPKTTGDADHALG